MTYFVLCENGAYRQLIGPFKYFYLAFEVKTQIEESSGWGCQVVSPIQQFVEAVGNHTLNFHAQI